MVGSGMLRVAFHGVERKAGAGFETDSEAHRHTLPRCSETPPSTFPQKQESAGRARWLVVRRGLPRYEKKITEGWTPGKPADRSQCSNPQYSDPKSRKEHTVRGLARKRAVEGDEREIGGLGECGEVCVGPCLGRD
jgi:hypothetical protein